MNVLNEDGVAAPVSAPPNQTSGIAEPKLPLKAQMVTRSVLDKVKKKKSSKKQLAEEEQIIADILIAEDDSEILFVEDVK